MDTINVFRNAIQDGIGAKKAFWANQEAYANFISNFREEIESQIAAHKSDLRVYFCAGELKISSKGVLLLSVTFSSLEEGYIHKCECASEKGAGMIACDLQTFGYKLGFYLI